MKRIILHIVAGILTITFVAAIVSSFGCAHTRRMPPDWYMVTGSGAADESLQAGQQRLMALKAAKTDAQRQLLEAAKGVQINSSTTVRDFMAQSDVIQSRVMGVIIGSQMMGEPRYNNDGTVEVDMRIDMNRIKHVVK
jgi:hypothetical protein